MYESLRISTLSPLGTPHFATEDTEFYGYSIPKNSMILFALGDDGYYEGVFDNLELFKPERYLSKDMKIKLTAFGMGFFFNEGDHWSEVRRFTLRFLGQVFNTPLETIVHDEMSYFFSTIRSGEVVEINENFSDFSVNYIFKVLCGISRGEYAVEVQTIKKLTEESIKQDRIEEHRATFDGTVRDYIDAFLVQQEKEKQMSKVVCYTDEQLLACMTDLLQPTIAGPVNGVAFCLLMVALNPSVQVKIHEELDRVVGRNRFPQLEDKIRLPYCEALIYETWRICPPSPLGVPHFATEDTEFYGYSIPKNSMILFALGDIGRYEGVFDDFTLFKPERYLSEDMKIKSTTFGMGKRACIGGIVAKNSIFLFITCFFQKYFISLPKGYENPTTEGIPGLATSITPFKLVITKRM